MDIFKIRKIIEKEVQKKTPPRKIFDMAYYSGLPIANFLPILHVFHPDFVIGNKELKSYYNADPKPGYFWDPVGDEVSIKIFEGRNKIAKLALERDYKTPKKTKRRKSTLFWFGLVLCTISTLISVVIIYLGKDLGLFGLLLIGPAFFGPWLNERKRKSNTEGDLIKSTVSESLGWAYSPQKDGRRFGVIEGLYPYCFAAFGANAYLSDEMWGTVSVSGKKRDVYISNIEEEYSVEGRLKDRIISQAIVGMEKKISTVIGARIKSKGRSGVAIRPSRIWFRGGIEMESAEFNDLFDVGEIKGEEIDYNTQVDIFMKLTPAVQEQLVVLGKINPKFTIFFTDGAFFFIKPGGLYSEHSLETNLEESIKIFDSDIDYVRDFVSRISYIGAEIGRYLD